MDLTEGFDPVINSDSRVLILGSHPGVQSLEKRQYYGNPGNAFWRTVYAVLGVEDPIDYDRRLRVLLDHGLALWDVYHKVERQGSLDTNIKNEVLNDFGRVFSQADIKLVIANGRAAFNETQRHAIFDDYDVRYCLSTSGLNNGREQARMAQWGQAISDGLGLNKKS